MLPRLTVWCSTDELRTHKNKTDKNFILPLYLLSYPATASDARVGIEPTELLSIWFTARTTTFYGISAHITFWLLKHRSRTCYLCVMSAVWFIYPFHSPAMALPVRIELTPAAWKATNLTNLSMGAKCTLLPICGVRLNVQVNIVSVVWIEKFEFSL